MSLVAANPRHRARRRRADAIFRYLCFGAAALGAAILVVFLAKIFLDGRARLSPEFLTSRLSQRPLKTGIWPAVVGSFYVMILTGLIAVPIGVAAAVYLEEFNTHRNRFTAFVQLNIANLAGVPSIVYGLLGLAVFVRWMALKQSVLAGAFTMALLILPMVIIVTQEALRAVPKSYREGSMALGSTQWQAIRYQVLPTALPGILTGVILALSRAIGETAPLIVVGAASYVSALPKKWDDHYTVLPIKIFDWSLEARHEFIDDAAAAILVLIVALLALNSVAIYLRSRARARIG
ncbi:phosphate ABC transporter permease PstA [Fimbriimonas ginsengisoli]|uniref:Phosphate transport system permease protein PstA n=1 Tax=Fimbriimonas ginsengisoli Gsoil 348 TaxID=661478 RepID=A0A068NR98_FIMGI|nr:phosphate ABC transporter permease PstA [Fimbriimonas ginsengisoli]AIE85295.1 phosphate ABC transporter membrane protein 2, PhoT family [Fimbriimonas ginsengisoli Gsoil 348]